MSDIEGAPAGDDLATPTRSRAPLIALIVVGVALAVLGVLAVAGVFSGEHEVDEAAWEASLEEDLGYQAEDFPALRDTFVDDICKEDETDFGYFVAWTDGKQSPDWLRTNIRYACPDRLPELEETLASLPNG
ncbi:MAG: hypothetical protein WKF79_06950 [Nocardioides sp.]